MKKINWLLMALLILFASADSKAGSGEKQVAIVAGDPDALIIADVDKISVNLPISKDQQDIKGQWRIVCRLYYYDNRQNQWLDKGFNEEMKATRKANRIDADFSHIGASSLWWGRCWAMNDDSQKLFIDPKSKYAREDIHGELAYEFLVNLKEQKTRPVPSYTEKRT